MSAAYNDGLLDLHQAYDVLRMHVNLQGGASSFVIAESAPNSAGLATAWLEQKNPSAFFPPQPTRGPGSTIIPIS
jgi:hypothetical protein